MLRHKRETQNEAQLREAEAAGGIAGQPEPVPPPQDEPIPRESVALWTYRG